jgi:predicted transcriptional regulator
MPLIQSPDPKPRKIKLTLRLDEPLTRSVHRYAEFIRASHEYVIAQALNYFFERDQEFKQWLEAHPNSSSQGRSRRSKTLQATPSGNHLERTAAPVERDSQ